MSETKLLWRKIKNIIFKSLIYGISFSVAIPLLLIIIYTLIRGASVLSLEFFISGSKPTGEPGAGILNALVGSGLLILLATLVATPVSIGCGIYLAEFKNSRLANIIRSAVNLIQGVPSIVLGLLGYSWFVLPLARASGGAYTFSILAGALTLSIMMLPLIIKATEETVLLIPLSLKESAMALGVPYYKTILKVVIPAALSGIVSGVLLAVARVAGETAPLLFTVFGNYYFNINLLKPADSLPLIIFHYAQSPYDDLHNIAWGAAVVLLGFVLLINLLVRLVVKKWKVQF